MEITAAEVMKLRKATNAGMMDCKHALQEAGGDMNKAVDIIRKKGLAIANKRADRDANEGCVLAKTNGKSAVVVSLNCETDFVAKNEGFIAFTGRILDVALATLPADREALLATRLDDRTVADHISGQTGVIGEKLELAYYGKVEAAGCVVYIHPGNKLATAVGFDKEVDAQVMKNIAMQVAAMAPIAVDKEEIPRDVIEHELEIGRGKAQEEGKPEAMWNMIAQGRLNKFYQESTLLNQTFEQDGKITVREYLRGVDKELKVAGFLRFSLS
jgi:elongation factor Ts